MTMQPGYSGLIVHVNVVVEILSDRSGFTIKGVVVGFKPGTRAYLLIERGDSCSGAANERNPYADKESSYFADADKNGVMKVHSTWQKPFLIRDITNPVDILGRALVLHVHNIGRVACSLLRKLTAPPKEALPHEHLGANNAVKA